MKYMTVKEASEKWNISIRRINTLLNDDRIEGAYKTSSNWMIPTDSSKPIDKRFRKKETNFILQYDFNLLNELDEKKKILNSKRPFSQYTLKSLRDNSILEFTYNSNAIEGNTLTLSETKVVLEGITIGGKSVREHLEATNHRDAIFYIMDMADRETKLTEWEIKNIHRLILKEIDNNNAGVYRNENVIISGAKHVPPAHYLVREQMGQLINNYQLWGELHPLIRAALLHGEFVKIHPFIDGNGRTSRLLMNLEVIKYGYPPIVIKNEMRKDYYESLDKAHTTSDYSDFVNLVLKASLESLNLYLKIVI